MMDMYRSICQELQSIPIIVSQGMGRSALAPWQQWGVCVKQ